MIDIYHGWSDKDESNEDRYHMFAAKIGIMTTGLGGFLAIIEDEKFNKTIHITYNGQQIPQERKEDFFEYCRSLNEH